MVPKSIATSNSRIGSNCNSRQNRIQKFPRDLKSIVLSSADSVIDGPMSNLIVLDFDGIHTADEVLNKLRSLQKEQLIDLEDACVVERAKDGKVHIKRPST